MDKKTLEKYSSAFTMSDMEIFVFPELLYSIVLANILSPRIWLWKEQPFLSNLNAMSNNRKIQRLKQFIIDNYVFNLDLETWGLTTKERELNRFQDIIDVEIIKNSNALFGYEGDKHYFDLDIRKHFGLEEYNDDNIPYWKTETVEAMDAFKYKPDHNVGAGECVSLSSLYAAALYIILDIPLENIFLLATPLHSQNFILFEDGIITNNRRILTKKMWFNGTELSQKARRALEKEKITIVSHISGFIHVAYDKATIEPAKYDSFSKKLQEFMIHPINFEIFSNFLRVNSEFQKYFQFQYTFQGKDYFIQAETLYHYEHSSKNKIGDASYKKFLEEIELEEFRLHQFPDREILNAIKHSLNDNNIYCRNKDQLNSFMDKLNFIPNKDLFLKQLKEFVCNHPELPLKNKNFINENFIDPSKLKSREEAYEYLKSIKHENEMAYLAFCAARYVDDSNWKPYIKAVIDRNPCSIELFKKNTINEVAKILSDMDNESIYDFDRLALPDEVTNFKRGDGFEKAVTLINVIRNRGNAPISLAIENSNILVSYENNTFKFKTNKNWPLSSKKPIILTKDYLSDN